MAVRLAIWAFLLSVTYAGIMFGVIALSDRNSLDDLGAVITATFGIQLVLSVIGARVAAGKSYTTYLEMLVMLTRASFLFSIWALLGAVISTPESASHFTPMSFVLLLALRIPFDLVVALLRKRMEKPA